MSKLEQLERLRGSERIRHWAQPNPWKGIRLARRPVIKESDVGFDGEGNTIGQPELIGVPCFGQPACYVRQGSGQELKRFDRYGVLRWTRCGRCTVREACHKVCKRRLDKIDGAWAAVDGFIGQGGAAALRDKKPRQQVVQAFDAVLRLLLKRGDFNSVNDLQVIEHYERAHAERRRKDAHRQAAKRLAKLRAGQLDDGAHELLSRHRLFRESELRQLLATMSSGLPQRLRMLNDGSVVATADAWHARVVLIAEQKIVNESAVAGLMIQLHPSRYQRSRHNALRQRVKNDLERADLLERYVPPRRSMPIWPPFDLLKEIAAEAAFTPYTI